MTLFFSLHITNLLFLLISPFPGRVGGTHVPAISRSTELLVPLSLCVLVPVYVSIRVTSRRLSVHNLHVPILCLCLCLCPCYVDMFLISQLSRVSHVFVFVTPSILCFMSMFVPMLRRHVSHFTTFLCLSCVCVFVYSLFVYMFEPMLRRHVSHFTTFLCLSCVCLFV